MKAKEFYELSAEQNNPDALYNLGVFYARGQGVEQNYLKAKQYFELSAINKIILMHYSLLEIFMKKAMEFLKII